MNEPLPGHPRNLKTVVTEVMEGLGSRAPIAVIVDGVKNVATYNEWTGWADASVTKSVRDALRQKGQSGLPAHLSVDGEYVALTLFSPEQYREAALAQARRGGEHLARVHQLAAACQEAHGQTFDATEIIREAVASVA